MPEDDIFMNFMVLDLTSGADSTTLVEDEESTGMTPFSNRPWGMAISQLEFDINSPNAFAADNAVSMGISTRQGQSSVPGIGAAGTVGSFKYQMTYQTSGIHVQETPVMKQYLPTVLIASPKLSFYFTTTANDAAFQSKNEFARIGFLTVEMTQRLWNEVAQTWALGD